MARAISHAVHRRTHRRLPSTDYVGLRRYSFTLRTYRGRHYFLDSMTVAESVRQMLRLGDEEQVAVLAYCFMPDHLHLFLTGTRLDGDALRFVARFKQAVSRWFSATFGRNLWQRGAWDRILRDDEPPERLIRYILMNPVQAGLVGDPLGYEFSGSLTLSRLELHRLVSGPV